ncbi:MAG: malonyl-CoA decarboxylase domain-containing protein [Acidimicrobiales bacterium]
MTLNARLTRVIRGVRRWRGPAADAPIPIDRDLPDSDWRHIAAAIDATVENRGGPVAARRRAKTVGLTYDSLSNAGRLRFFQGLATEYDHDDRLVDEAIDAVIGAEDPQERRRAEADLRARLQPQREVLFKRLASLDGGLPFLISMRADLLPHRSSSVELGALDRDLRGLLEGWFDVGLLRLERLTWDTPASFLEKLIEYEAVHAIESWDDLKHRLGPGRRCYAFVHPGMPDDPLILVEVALTKNIARRLTPLLARGRAADRIDDAGAVVSEAGIDGDRDHPGEDDEDEVDEQEFDTAIFYSISNCHDGLAGVSLGDFLIKSVVEELSAELPKLKTFATLSPLPGFRSWLSDRIEDEQPLVVAGEEGAAGGSAAELERELVDLIGGPLRPPTDPALDRLKPILMRLAAGYLLEARRGDRAADPVAHFHLSNGARVEHLNWMGNPSLVGWERGLGMMVNYRYDLKTIERNHDTYTSVGEVAVSDEIRTLAAGPKS